MIRAMRHPLIVFAIACCLPGAALAQRPLPQRTLPPPPVVPASPEVPVTLAPPKNPATVEQIREYLRLSGDMDSFRARWIAAVDKNRSIGAPYWPESFWTNIKAEMGKTDLMPMYVTLYQHGISKDLMQEVLNTYHLVGATLFKLSPAAYKLNVAQQAMADDTNKLTLAKTLEVIQKVYAIYKPQIEEARARYLAEHPGSLR